MYYSDEKFRKHNFIGSAVTNVRRFYTVLCIDGDFAQCNEYKHFSFSFNHIEGNVEKADDIKTIEKIEIEKSGERCHVVLNDMEFTCGYINMYIEKYKGMSYRNIYGTEEYQKYTDELSYIEDEKYFDESEIIELPDGYSLEVKSYANIEEKEKGYAVNHGRIDKCRLEKSGETIYEFRSYYNHPCKFKEFIDHSNGHRYFPFHIDLYGISYLDLDTRQVFHYLPEGRSHDCDSLFGESFIITDIHYDRESDLIAYGGCFWACPNGVMVGRFSDPLNFDPHLVDIHTYFDPEYDEVDDVDFKEWRDGRLYVMCDKQEKSISVQELIDLINKNN